MKRLGYFSISVILVSVLGSLVSARQKEVRVWILSRFSDTVLAAWDKAVADFWLLVLRKQP